MVERPVHDPVAKPNPQTVESLCETRAEQRLVGASISTLDWL